MGIKAVKGYKEALQSLRGLSENAAKQAERTLKERLPGLLSEVNTETPVKTGYLRSRNQVRVIREEAQVKEEIINDAPYALAVHERPPEEGQNKFIEKVVNRHAQGLGEALGRDQVKMLKKLEREAKK